MSPLVGPLEPPPELRAPADTRAAIFVSALSPFVTAGALVGAGICATDAVQPCFYPWAGIGLAGAAGTTGGPLTVLLLAERDRRRLEPSRDLSLADAGLVAWGGALGLTATTIAVAGHRDAATDAGYGAGACALTGLVLAFGQLERNGELRRERWRAEHADPPRDALEERAQETP